MRYVKVILAAFVALFCLMYATQNVMNLQAGHSFVALMAGMEGHEAYPAHFGPPVTSTALIWLMLCTIITLEYVAGILAARGTWEMWKARSDSAEVFNASKTYALLACGVGMIIWFGIFHAFGGAYFQMCQIDAGRGPLIDSASFSIQMGVILLVINLQDS
jgi:predicted small integral membrane protein